MPPHPYTLLILFHKYLDCFAVSTADDVHTLLECVHLRTAQRVDALSPVRECADAVDAGCLASDVEEVRVDVAGHETGVEDFKVTGNVEADELA